MKNLIKVTFDGIDETGKISDGYHTLYQDSYDKLYEHRITLFIALCRYSDLAWVHGKKNKDGKETLRPWRSKLHSDGKMYGGWFIMGIGKKEGEQITYHLPLSKWEETVFAEDLEKAPKFDGHTSEDVLKRISEL